MRKEGVLSSVGPFKLSAKAAYDFSELLIPGCVATINIGNSGCSKLYCTVFGIRDLTIPQPHHRPRQPDSERAGGGRAERPSPRRHRSLARPRAGRPGRSVALKLYLTVTR